MLGFPQQKQQKRHCCIDWHECHKPTFANKTPQMPHRFYLRPVSFVASHYGVASPLLALMYCSLLRWRAPLPHRFSITLELPQILHQANGVVGIHSILLLLLLLCLYPAATDCSCCCNWRVGVLGYAISEYSNWKRLLPKPLGRTSVP